MKKLLPIFSILILVCITFTSCKENPNSDINPDAETIIRTIAILSNDYTPDNSIFTTENDYKIIGSSVYSETYKIRKPAYNVNEYNTIYHLTNYSEFTGFDLNLDSWNVKEFSLSTDFPNEADSSYTYFNDTIEEDDVYVNGLYYQENLEPSGTRTYSTDKDDFKVKVNNTEYDVIFDYTIMLEGTKIITASLTIDGDDYSVQLRNRLNSMYEADGPIDDGESD